MAERSFWNPMTNVGAFRERGLMIVRGEGSTVWDDAGNALLDVSAALWYCNVGQGRAELADAAAAGMRDRGASAGVGGAGALRRREDLFPLGRRRLDRHGGEARARVLGGGRQAGQAR